MSQSAASASAARIDLVGTGVSLMCALHCLTVPFLVTVLPLASVGLLFGGALEILFLIASVALAAGSLCWGFRQHREWPVLAVLGAALTMIGVGRFLASEPYEIMFVVMGAVVLAGGHLLNRYLCRTCKACPDGKTRRRS
jgi:hypothetical protein